MGPRERNPWLALVFDAVSAQLGAPIPPPGVPGPFSLDDPEHLLDLLSDAALDDVRVREIPVPLRAASFEEWWTRTSALAGPLAQMLSGLPDDAAGCTANPSARGRSSVPDTDGAGASRASACSRPVGARSKIPVWQKPSRAS